MASTPSPFRLFTRPEIIEYLKMDYQSNWKTSAMHPKAQWVPLPGEPGWEVTSRPLWDPEAEIYARLSCQNLIQWCDANGCERLSDTDAKEIELQFGHVPPALLVQNLADSLAMGTLPYHRMADSITERGYLEAEFDDSHTLNVMKYFVTSDEAPPVGFIFNFGDFVSGKPGGQVIVDGKVENVGPYSLIYKGRLLVLWQPLGSRHNKDHFDYSQVAMVKRKVVES